MVFEMLVGLNVTDDAGYQEYRNGMTPILQSYGGGFGYDLRVSEVLKSPEDAPINRVFTIYFRDEESKKAFFEDESYLAVRNELFDSAVSHTTLMATYVRADD